MSRAAQNLLLANWCRKVTGDVLSIGSGTDTDRQGGHYRDYFSRAASYTTSECVPTDCCDRILDVRAMPSVPTESVDVVFCGSVLEHVDDIHASVRECWRILKPGGTFLVGVPFNQPPHKIPHDYWRFTEFGVRYLLRAFTVQKVVGVDGAPEYPCTYWARAVKPEEATR